MAWLVKKAEKKNSWWELKECHWHTNKKYRTVCFLCLFSAYQLVEWNDLPITLFREYLYVIGFNISFIIWSLAYISNLRPLKAKFSVIQAFGFFWQFLAIFAFLAELGNFKHFEPNFFFEKNRQFGDLAPWKFFFVSKVGKVHPMTEF